MSADLQIQIRDLQARCAKLEALAEEVWGVLVTAALMEKTTHPDIRTALMRVERRLRQAGIKRFPSTAAEGEDIAPEAPSRKCPNGTRCFNPSCIAHNSCDQI